MCAFYNYGKLVKKDAACVMGIFFSFCSTQTWTASQKLHPMVTWWLHYAITSLQRHFTILTEQSWRRQQYLKVNIRLHICFNIIIYFNRYVIALGILLKNVVWLVWLEIHFRICNVIDYLFFKFGLLLCSIICFGVSN